MKEQGVEKIGEINGVGIYFDKHQDETKFLVGHKGGSKVVADFLVGGTRDISLYEQALENFNENYTDAVLRHNAFDKMRF